MLTAVLQLVCPDGGSGNVCGFPVAGPVTFPSSMATSQASIAAGFSDLATRMVGYLALIAPVILGLALLSVGLKLFASWSTRMADGEEHGEDFEGDDGDGGEFSDDDEGGDDGDEDGDSSQVEVDPGGAEAMSSEDSGGSDDE